VVESLNEGNTEEDYQEKLNERELIMAETYVDKNGYRRFSDSGILVHRWVAEKKIGRPLKKEEEVHHKGSKLDNKPHKISVKRSHSAHTKTHLARKKFTGKW